MQEIQSEDWTSQIRHKNYGNFALRKQTNKQNKQPLPSFFAYGVLKACSKQNQLRFSVIYLIEGAALLPG